MYNMNFPPRDNQKEFIYELLNHLKEHGYIRGILQALPGVGKTYTGIYLGQFFKKPLIIVPKEILADQWKDSILEFSDLNEEDVQIIEGSDMKKISEQLENGKIFIAKVQSLLSQIKRNNPLELMKIYQCIDLVIFDEAHNAGALGFSKALSIFQTPNIFGLTATPFRKGINEFLLLNSIGDIIVEADAEVMTPFINITRLPQTFIKFEENELKYLNRLSGDYIKFLTFFNMFLERKNTYFDFLSDWVNYYTQLNHEIVLLFSTNKMAKKAKEFIESKYKTEVLMLTGNSKNDALNIAKQENRKLKDKLKEYKEELNEKVKNKEIKRKEANALYKAERLKSKELQDLNLEMALDLYNKKIKEAKIISSNFGLLREGFDKPKLSTVIFGSPIIGKVSVIQTLGRVTRLSEGKQTPIAHFFIHEIFEKHSPYVMKIIENNVRTAYPEAPIKFV